ncbi:hypothetical protein [Streptosporangium sp. NPDC000509]|uniref:hypothetical protein n=1 Tax=Streptosporangium sp. NPDC000509 TaxID=3366186 RepID=UPI0036C5FE11
MTSAKTHAMALRIKSMVAQEAAESLPGELNEISGTHCHVAEIDDELVAIRLISKVLAERSVEARGRILRYLSDRWETADVPCAERHGHSVAGAPSSGAGSWETDPVWAGVA